MTRQTTIREIKRGEFFTLKDYGEYPPERAVYTRGDYDRTEKKYECGKWSDISHSTYLKADRKVWVDFTF